MSLQRTRGTQFFALPDAFTLESGAILHGARLAYRTWGHPRNAAQRAVLVCHALTGSDDAGQWWPGIIGPGLALDTEQDFIVCSNVLGGCSGSTGPADIDPASGSRYGSRFPALSLRDLVRAQALLLDSLQIPKLSLVIGGSLGGMQALEWAASYPERVGAVVVLAAAATQPAWAIAQSHLQRTAIETDRAWCGGDYDARQPPTAGFSLARMIAMSSYRHWQEFDARFGRREDSRQFLATRYLDHHGERIVERFDAASYVALTRIMDTHDVARGRGDLASALRPARMPALIIGIDTDLLYPPAEQRALAAALPEARYVEVKSACGHDGFLLEVEAVGAEILHFRQKTRASAPA